MNYNRFFAIVLAAGRSERFSASLLSSSYGSVFSQDLYNSSKLSFEIGDGLSVLDCSLRRICSAGLVDSVVVVAKIEDIESLQRRYSPHNIPTAIFGLSSKIHIIAGGASRQESVFCGLKYLEGKGSIVLVHDGARPLCHTETVKQAIKIAQHDRVAILAAKVSSTIKKQASEATSAQKKPVFV